MPEATYDPFALSSGLPLADVDATITAVDFRFDTSYAADACVAAITFDPDEGEEQEQLYSLGRGWEPVDRGAAAAHQSGKESLNFNANSNMGRFIVAAGQDEDFRSAVASEGLDLRTAEAWVGRRFHLTTQEFTTRNPSTGAEKERSIIVPSAYLGTADGGSKAPAKKTAAKGPSAIEKKQHALIDELEAEDGGEEIVAALRELAGEVEDFDAFMEGAMEIDGVADSDAAQKVAMSSKAGSIWAQAQG